jgi:hypothetical protein
MNSNSSLIDNSVFIHVLIISSHSINRYKEAEISIKSLLYNRNNMTNATASTTSNGDSSCSSNGDCSCSSNDDCGDKINMNNTIIIIHLVVDKNGLLYFTKLFEIDKILENINNVIIIFHDFNSICNEHLHRFLDMTNMTYSHHHSGSAGYCRLFIPIYFNNQSLYINNNNVNQYNVNEIVLLSNIDHIITIESDQIILGSIIELWKYCMNIKLNNNKILIAAAENYILWNYSVVNDTPIYNTNDSSENSDAVEMDDGVNHGYGIVGGVMIFYLDRFRLIDNWLLYLSHNIDIYRSTVLTKHTSRSHGHDDDINNCDSTSNSACMDSSVPSAIWSAKYNDQDIFNLLYTLHAYLFHILPCEWNIQYHARLNSIIYCNHYINWNTDNILHTLNEIPLNCKESRQKHFFVCPREPKVLHYMASSYSVDGSYLMYFNGYWNMYEKLNWNILV